MKSQICRKCLLVFLLILPLFVLNTYAQGLSASDSAFPVKYEELTAPQFVRAVETSARTCIIPVGILEKHGPHLPLGTDLFDAREIVMKAVKKEYSIVFPAYYFGQIYEARHQPGTIAYSSELIWKLLQETCDELARNGLKKILIVNGHGGNNNFLHYFCQAQLASQRDYAVYLFSPESDSTLENKIKALRKTTAGGHADEMETSMMLAHRPDLTHVEQGSEQSGVDQKRLSQLPGMYTAIWWYARYPNHYAGDGSQASVELGNLILDSRADQLAELIGRLKKDTTVSRLQEEFYKSARGPLNTDQ